MSYDSDEISVASGQPVELFQWRLKDTSTYWRYTTAGYDIVYGGETFFTEPGLSRDRFEEINDPMKQELICYFPTNHSFVNLFAFQKPTGLVEFTLYRGHDTNFVQYWTGILKTVSTIHNRTSARILMGPFTDVLGDRFLTRRYHRSCDVPLYSNECAANKELYKVTGTITAISGYTVDAVAFGSVSDDYLKGGIFVANQYKRKIKAHDSYNQRITLIYPIPGLYVGQIFIAYAGCNHTKFTCIDRFNNLLNFRGCDYIPNDEPFTQGILQ